MHRTFGKPVRKCHRCPLNLGDRCWGYRHPREQWRRHEVCPGFADACMHRRFAEWKREAHVKNRRQIRQEAFRTHPEEPVFHFEEEPAAR